MAALKGRTQGVEDKRRQLLEAAVRVFARKGYHASRVGDIAEEAGVAHGLLYHYFKSKDQVLEAVFHENWSVLQARIASVEETDEPAADQIRHIAAIVLRTWLHLPDVVRVVIQEFGRIAYDNAIFLHRVIVGAGELVLVAFEQTLFVAQVPFCCFTARQAFSRLSSGYGLTLLG